MWLTLLFGIVISVILGGLLEPSLINWKSIEIIIILTGSLAVITTVAEAKRLPLSNSLTHKKPHLASRLSVTKSLSKTYVEIIEFRIKNNSSNLQEYKSCLHWFQKAFEVSNILENAEPKTIKQSMPDFPSGITDREIILLKSEIIDSLDCYENTLKDYKEIISKLERTPAEDFAVSLAPFTLTVAISLALFRAISLP